MRESTQLSPGILGLGAPGVGDPPLTAYRVASAGVIHAHEPARFKERIGGRSLYRRLLWASLMSFILVWLLLLMWFVWEVTRVGSGYFDRDLLDVAEAFTDLFSADIEEPQRRHMLVRRVEQFSRAYAESPLRDHEFSYRITDVEGVVLAQSSAWPELSKPVLGAAPANEGLWRTALVESRDQSVQAQVAVAHTFLQRAHIEILIFFLLPLIAILPILATLLRVGIARALTPMENLTRAIIQHVPQPTTPLNCAGSEYRELRPVFDSVNQLLSRLATYRENERRFFADATHQLRTPLATLGAQVHLMVGAESPEQRAELAEMLIASIERSAALVGNLLTLSRLESASTNNLELSSLDVATLAKDVVARHAPRAIVKDMDLAYDGPEAMAMCGDASALESALDSMIDNAMVHCPPGSTVCLEITQESRFIWVAVSDDGPGIPAALRDEVLKRFVRLPGAIAGGSGLGLAIVKRVADLHEGTVRLGEGLNGRGLRVAVCLPSRTATPCPSTG